ncbi:MAG: HD domain-containing phosphohydrolase [Actinomycetota bacterium]
MTEPDRLLIVDDDANLLAGLSRLLGEQFAVTTVDNGPDALRKVVEEGPFAAVLCDMRMPGMDGIDVLRRLAEISPDTVRMMLTGNADQKTAVEAVNRGKIFRFFNKPTPIQDLRDGIDAAMVQYRLVVAERQLLEQTLAGSVALLTDVLSLVAPDSFRRVHRIRPWATAVARHLGMVDAWVVEMAVELSQLGAIAVPPDVLARHHAGQLLSPAEEDMVARIPDTGAALIRKIPRLAPVADAVQFQAARFVDRSRSRDLPLAARILSALIALDTVGAGRPSPAALAVLTKDEGHYDPAVLAAVRNCLVEATLVGGEGAEIRLDVPAADIRVGDVLESDLRLENDRLVLAAGGLITEMLFLRLQNVLRMNRMKEPVGVRRRGQAALL